MVVRCSFDDVLEIQSHRTKRCTTNKCGEIKTIKKISGNFQQYDRFYLYYCNVSSNCNTICNNAPFMPTYPSHSLSHSLSLSPFIPTSPSHSFSLPLLFLSASLFLSFFHTLSISPSIPPLTLPP